MKNKMTLLFTLFFLCGIIFAAELTENIKKGMMKMAMNRLDDAQSYFERERSSNPKNGLAYYYLGEVFYRKADFSNALEQYQKALEIEPDNARYHLGIGLTYLALNQTNKAIEEFQTVINSSPNTYEAEIARQKISMVKASSRDSEIVKKWQEAEKFVPKEQTTKETEQVPGMIPGVQTPLVSQTLSVEALVKDLRFGTETKRKEASKTLYGFSPTQLEPFLPQFIAHMSKEKNDEIKKNLLLVIGKTQTKEAVDYLFEVLDNPEYSFDTKMVALAGLSETLSPDAAERLKDILDTMVTRKIRLREDARTRIQQLEQKMDDLESQKIVANNDLTKLRTQRQEIESKLSIQSQFGEGAAPGVPGVAPGVPGVAPPEMPRGEQTIKPLSEAEVKQLRAEQRKIENDIKTKEKQIERFETQLAKLKAEKEKYENLLVKRYSTGAVKVLGVTRSQVVQQQPGMPAGMPVEAPQIPPTFSAQPSSQEASSEELNEQSLALSIIKILGRIGKPEYLPVIEKAWDEYRADSFELDYGLVRAQLGSYDYIEKLVARLQEDYSSSDIEEVYFRAEIVKVLGNYLSKYENQDYADLIAYLAESDPNQAVKIAANQALSKIKTKEPEKTAKKG